MTWMFLGKPATYQTTYHDVNYMPQENQRFTLSSHKIVHALDSSAQAVEIYLKAESAESEGIETLIDKANTTRKTVAIDFFMLTCLMSVCEKIPFNNIFVNLSPFTLADKKALDDLIEKCHVIQEMGKQLLVEINQPPLPLNSADYIAMYHNCMKLARHGIKFAPNIFYREVNVSVHLQDEYTPFIKLARNLLFKSQFMEKSRHGLERDIHIAKSKGKIVIAEGIETEEELELCRELECDWAQGYYFHQPQPLFKKGLSLDEEFL